MDLSKNMQSVFLKISGKTCKQITYLTYTSTGRVNNSIGGECCCYYPAANKSDR